MDRLKNDLNEANKKLSKYQDSLEEVRNEIEEIETEKQNKPKTFIPNSRTFDGKFIHPIFWNLDAVFLHGVRTSAQNLTHEIFF